MRTRAASPISRAERREARVHRRSPTRAARSRAPRHARRAAAPTRRRSPPPRGRVARRVAQRGIAPRERAHDSAAAPRDSPRAVSASMMSRKRRRALGDAGDQLDVGGREHHRRERRRARRSTARGSRRRARTRLRLPARSKPTPISCARVRLDAWRRCEKPSAPKRTRSWSRAPRTERRIWR